MVRPMYAKNIILYHRSYRKISGSFKLFLLQMALAVAPVSLAGLWFYPEITHGICHVAEYVLQPHFPQSSLKIVEQTFLVGIGDYSFLSLPGTFPSPFLCQVNAAVCLAALFVLNKIERAKPIIVFLIMVALIQLLSAGFILAFPQHFPYDATEYSRLYIIQQISLFFFIPLVAGVAILPLPSPIGLKFIIVWTTVVYSLIFGTLRYIVFLYFLSTFSVLYMAVIFFMMGPLVDFIYISGIYSVFAAYVAKKMKGDAEIWKW